MAQSQTPVPRGQVSIPPEICEQMKGIYELKGGLSTFSKQTGIKSDTLRLAMKRGTTTVRTLERIKAAVEKSPLPVLASRSRTDTVRSPSSNGHVDAAVEHIEHLPPAVLRHIQRVSSALLDGMQLMQLTMLKALQEELLNGNGAAPPPSPSRGRAR